MSVRGSALRAARRGWPVLPCHNPVPGGCSCGSADCGSPGKHPRTRRGLQDASTDEARVRAWWTRWPDANLGIRTGAASGLVVIDVDQAHGGFDTLAKLKADGAFPHGLQVSTGSDGLHLYFAHPGRTVRNSVGALGPGVDVRGDGGYVVAPPSRHASGGSYRWKGPLLIPHLPDHLLDRIGQREPGRARRPDRSGVSSPNAWAVKALEAETMGVSRTPAGGRNHRLNLAAFNLGQIAGNGLLDTSVVVEELHRAALTAGLRSREALRTIRSGLQAGMQAPRGPSTSRPDDTPAVDRDLDMGIQSG